MHYINFSLLQPNTRGESLITLYVTINGDRIRMSTKLKLQPRMWDRKKKGVTTSKSKIQWYVESGYGSEVQLRSIQHHLNQLRAEVDNFLLGNSGMDDATTLLSLKNHLRSFLNPRSEHATDKSVVTEYISHVIQEMRSGYRKKNDGKPFTGSTIECYQTFLQVLKMYEAETKSMIKWNDINKRLYLHFIQWNENRGVSTNYTGRLIKDMKCIMRTAHEEGVHANEEYRKRFFSVPKERKKKVPLSLDEIHQLYNLNIEEPKGLVIARDIFVCGCFVGLRISDLKRIQPEHVMKDTQGYYLTMTTLKTGAEVKIPLNKIALSILRKYGFTLPKHSEQSINRNLKVLGKMIGLKEDRVFSLSLHHSRHTFARLAYQMGVQSMFIMKMTGHQSEKSFLNYINISMDQAMDQFRKAGFSSDPTSTGM